ncbi:MAG: sigma-70 family RNA polymerase sigma factor [Bacteroidales bacterium]|nr:sigma-70 family RNA polymerase sigma factor [Bacteroidales bacterium]
MEINPNFTDKARRDFELVQRALGQNDRNAYAALMNNYRDAIYFMLLKMTNNKDDADDLTIEAFGKAFKNLNLYTPNYAFSTWLFKIATNNCIDFLRKRKQQNISLDQEFDDNPGSQLSRNVTNEDLNPEETIINEQKIKYMRTIVDKLKPHYRVLIELRYFEELSYEEISEQLNLPMGTVKAKLFRARDLLYNIINKTPDAI